jgi:hypothetical protein
MSATRREATRFFGPRGARLRPGAGALGAVLWLLILLAGTGLTHADAPRADADSCLRAHEEAQLQRLKGRYLAAREQLLQCAQAACPALVRGDCKTWLGEVETSLPSVVLAVVDDAGRDLIDVRVSSAGQLLSDRVDGRAVLLDPGVYMLRFEAPGYAQQELQLSIREAEKQRIVRVVLHAVDGAAPASASAETLPSAAPSSPAQRPQRLRQAGYVLSGVALAAVATGIGFGVSGKKKLDELQACKPDCPKGEANTGKRRYIIADSMFALAGAAAVAAAVTLWLGLRKADKQPQSSAGVDLHRGGVSLTWNAEF